MYCLMFIGILRVRRFAGITEITTEFTKMWFNGVYYTTIYYYKLYFNISLHDFIIKQINILLLPIQIQKSPTKLQPVPQTWGILVYISLSIILNHANIV